MLIRGELVKAATTRTVLAFAAVTVVLGTAQVLVTILVGEPASVADKETAIAGLPLIVLLLGLVGAAGEYRHRTAAPAVLASGRDAGRLLLARAAAYAVVGVAVAAPATAVMLAVGLPLLASRPGPALGAGDVALVAAGSLAAAAAAAAFGVALGALVRNQVAAVTGTLVVVFVVLPLVQIVSMTALEATPFGAAQGVAGNGPEELSRGATGLVLAGWTLAALVAAAVAERRRDLA